MNCHAWFKSVIVHHNLRQINQDTVFCGFALDVHFDEG
jgi:hypothetical protein